MSRNQKPYRLVCRDCGATAEVDVKRVAQTSYGREACVLRAMRRKGWLWRGGPVSTHRAEVVCPPCTSKLRVLRLEEDPGPLPPSDE